MISIIFGCTLAVLPLTNRQTDKHFYFVPKNKISLMSQALYAMFVQILWLAKSSKNKTQNNMKFKCISYMQDFILTLVTEGLVHV